MPVNFGGGLNVSGGQVSVGDNNQLTQNVNSPEATRSVFESMATALPEENRAELEQEVVRPLMTYAELPPEEVTPEIEAESKTLLGRLAPYGPKIAKACLAFGEGALTTLATRNPIINGLVSAIQAWRQPDYDANAWQPRSDPQQDSWIQ